MKWALAAAFAILACALMLLMAQDQEDRRLILKAPPVDQTQALPLPVELLPPLKTEPSLTRDRGTILPLLYLMQAGLQVADVVSTRAALGAGAHEANPLFPIEQRPGLAYATKIGTTALTFYLVEREVKTNRKAAIITMVLVNGMMTAVVAHNIGVKQAAR